MRANVIVWDLETVPDLAGFAAANDLVGQTDADIRAVIGNKFPKHIYHTIVCIRALVAHRESDHWAVDALGAPHVGKRTEKQLIGAFCSGAYRASACRLSPAIRAVGSSNFNIASTRVRDCDQRGLHPSLNAFGQRAGDV